jgi:hypothetical protein
VPVVASAGERLTLDCTYGRWMAPNAWVDATSPPTTRVVRFEARPDVRTGEPRFVFASPGERGTFVPVPLLSGGFAEATPVVDRAGLWVGWLVRWTDGVQSLMTDPGLRGERRQRWTSVSLDGELLQGTRDDGACEVLPVDRVGDPYWQRQPLVAPTCEAAAKAVASHAATLANQAQRDAEEAEAASELAEQRRVAHAQTAQERAQRESARAFQRAAWAGRLSPAEAARLAELRALAAKASEEYERTTRSGRVDWRWIQAEIYSKPGTYGLPVERAALVYGMGIERYDEMCTLEERERLARDHGRPD